MSKSQVLSARLGEEVIQTNPRILPTVNRCECETGIDYGARCDSATIGSPTSLHVLATNISLSTVKSHTVNIGKRVAR